MRKEIIGDATLYLGDCREILPQIGHVAAVITDPPYPDYYVDEYKYFDGILKSIEGINCRQFVFWTSKVDFPLSYTAIHIWDKMVGVASSYERIYERNGQKNYKLFNAPVISNKVSAQMASDIYTGHPSQKPIRLMNEIVESHTKRGNIILDPFCGSGSTGRACIKSGRKFIGVELCQKWFDLSCKLLEEAQKQTSLFDFDVRELKQESLL